RAADAAEAALAHVPASKVVAAYQRSDLLEQRRGLMGQWAAYLTKPPATVVPLFPQAAARSTPRPSPREATPASRYQHGRLDSHFVAFIESNSGKGWQRREATMDGNGLVVMPGKGPVWSMEPGRSSTVKLRNGETDESVMMFEEVAPVGTATPMH